MIEIKMPEEEEMPANNHSREEAHSIIKLLVNAYNMGYKDGVEAYKAMEIEKEEKEEDAEDCISRQAVLDALEWKWAGKAAIDAIKNLPSVTPQAEIEKEEPAEWIVDTDDSRRWDRVRFYCSACNGWNTYGKSKYCPNCGRRMQSED